MDAPRRAATHLGAPLLAAAVLVACEAPTDPSLPRPGDGTLEAPPGAAVRRGGPPLGGAFLRVYDRNVFLGGDTGPLFVLDFGPDDLPGLVEAVEAFWQQVLATGTEERAAAIADEIARTRPHLVALQEVAAYVVVELATGLPLDGRDFLAALEAELAARDLAYRLVARQAGTDAALPLALGASGVTHLLAFRVGEAVLVHRDVDVADVETGFFRDFAQLGPVALRRGFIHVEFPFHGLPHHLVTTQLETQGLRSLHDRQAEELLARFGALDGLTILTGDLNSDAAGQPGDPSWTPTYGRLLDQGFVDLWEVRVGADEAGLTCCRDPDLVVGALDQRLDLVLLRADPDLLPVVRGGIPGSFHVEVLGDDPGDRIESSGLWPSDHAGLVAALNLPRGRLLADEPPGVGGRLRR